MSTLVIVTQSFPYVFGIDAIGDLIAKYLVTQSPSALTPFAFSRAVILHPASVGLDAALYGAPIPYDTGIGLERNQAQWRPLLDREFDEIFILGIDPIADYEEIVLACYLKARAKRHLSRHGIRDLATWQTQVKPDLLPHEIQMQRLGNEKQRQYVRTVNQWLGGQLAGNDFNPPVAVQQRQPDVLLYQYSRLAIDLAQKTQDLQVEAHGESASIMMCEGALVHSSDFHRSIANFAMAIEGPQTVLDVGCGSGFLACHLAASGRYKDVLGIDASSHHVDSARLHAELNGCTARFETMSMTDIQLPDRAVDLSLTSFALEQAGDDLERCFAEIRRVTAS